MTDNSSLIERLGLSCMCGELGYARPCIFCEAAQALRDAEEQLDRIKQESPEAYQWLVNINAHIAELEELTAADKLEIGSYRDGTGLRGENRAQGQRIAELRRSIDNIKVRAYELGQIELHDMALESLKGDV